MGSTQSGSRRKRSKTDLASEIFFRRVAVVFNKLFITRLQFCLFTCSRLPKVSGPGWYLTGHLSLAKDEPGKTKVIFSLLFGLTVFLQVLF